MEISIKRVTFASSFGFLMTLCLAAASSGCVGAPDEVVGEDPADPALPVDPGPTVVEPAEPAVPVDCTIGELQEVGPASEPAIAGSPDGFALAYRERPIGDATVMVFDHDGAPTGPANILPASNVYQHMELVGGPDGYDVTTGSIEGIIRPNLFHLGQGGAVESSAMDLESYIGMQIARSETKLRAFWIDPQMDWTCPNGGSPHMMFGTLAADGTATEVIAGPCNVNVPGIFTGYWWNGFAAHDESMLMTIERTSQQADVWHRALWTVVATDDGVTEVQLAQYDSNAYGGTYVWVRRSLATDDGYAVLWRRWSWGAVTDNSSFLTFIGKDGGFRGTIEMPAYGADIAWNAETKEFGLIRDYLTETGNHVAFDRLDRDGQIIETEVFYAGGDTDNRLFIAESGGDYAVAILTGYPDTALRFVNVACQ